MERFLTLVPENKKTTDIQIKISLLISEIQKINLEVLFHSPFEQLAAVPGHQLHFV